MDLADIPLGKLFFALFGVENALDRRLAVVEVALDRHNVDVLPILRAHLQLLHLGDAVVGVDDHDLDALSVAEAFERRLARIAARRDEDEDGLLDAQKIAPLP